METEFTVADDAEATAAKNLALIKIETVAAGLARDRSETGIISL